MKKVNIYCFFGGVLSFGDVESTDVASGYEVDMVDVNKVLVEGCRIIDE